MKIIPKGFFYIMFLVVMGFVLFFNSWQKEKLTIDNGYIQICKPFIQFGTNSAATGLKKHAGIGVSSMGNSLFRRNNVKKSFFDREWRIIERKNKVIPSQILILFIFVLLFSGFMLIFILGMIRKNKNNFDSDPNTPFMKRNWILNMEIKLRGADIKINNLKKKAAKANEEKYKDYRKLIRDLQMKSDSIQNRMSEFIQSNGQVQDEMQQSIEKIFSDLENELKAASKIIK